MDVQPIVQRADGTFGLGASVRMGAILVAVSADRMGRIPMVAMQGGNNSRLACHFCHLNGVHVGGSVRQLGYVENKEAKCGKCKGQILIVGVDDDKRLLDHSQQHTRATAVDVHTSR